MVLDGTSGDDVRGDAVIPANRTKLLAIAVFCQRLQASLFPKLFEEIGINRVPKSLGLMHVLSGSLRLALMKNSDR
jgi:hypothetical protein